MYFTSIKISK